MFLLLRGRGDDETIALDELPAAIAEARCAGVPRCCADAEESESVERCVSSEHAKMEEGIPGGIEAPRTDYDPVQAARCVTEIRSNALVCYDPKRRATSTACGAMFTGSRPQGSPCTVDDCAPVEEGEAACIIGFDGPDVTKAAVAHTTR